MSLELESETVVREEAGRPRNLRVLRVSWELLASVLKLPPGTQLVGIHGDILTDQVLIKLTHPDFPEIEDGCRIPEVVAKFAQRREAVFVGWQQ